jgi:amino acid transporter
VAQTEPVTVTADSEDFDISDQGDVAKLKKGAIGLGGVLFLTVTGSAPITAMLLNTPIVVGSGEGIGTPAAFIVATVVLTIFSVGYVAMSRKKTAKILAIGLITEVLILLLFDGSTSTQYAGHWVTSVMSYLIITGSFACGMAFHNTTARYAYSLGREGMLPPVLGKTHPKWQSPHIASIATSVLSLIIIGLFAMFIGTNDPSSQAYGLMAVMGVIIILSVQALVSLAVLVYYLRDHRDEVHRWTTVLAPVMAFISQGYVVYLLFENLNFLGAGTYGYAKLFGPIDAAVVLIGIGLAFYYKKYKPETFDKVGRLINEGL